MSKDEITLREAAELLKAEPALKRLAVDDGADRDEKRRREVGNAGATLEAMLGASRRGKTVRGKQ